MANFDLSACSTKAANWFWSSRGGKGIGRDIVDILKFIAETSNTNKRIYL